MGTLYRWTRDAHLYIGMAISPFLLMFAISVWALNHPSPPSPPEVVATGIPVRVPPGIENLDGMERVNAAREILRQLNVDGEIGFTSYSKKRGLFTIPVALPGRDVTVSVSLPDGRASVERSPWSLRNAANWMHKLPGPHLKVIRGNWGPTRQWRWMADALVYGLLFVCTTGVYMWFVVKAGRRVGLILLGAGALSFCGIVYALV